MPLAFAEILLQGEPGSSIELSVLTPRQADPQKMTLVRAPLVYPAVTGKLVTDEGPDAIGLITTSTLQAGRARGFRRRLADLEKQGAKRLMLDLRYCALGPDRRRYCRGGFVYGQGSDHVFAGTEVPAPGS